MANPFANAPHFTSELNGAYLFGIQTGQKTYEQGGVDQMKYITLNQLTAFVRGTFGNLWNYRGEYPSALPTNLAVNDYFLATGTFTVDGVTFTSGHMYAYNGSAWSDITNTLAQYATAEEVTGINDRLEIAESRITALSGGIVPKGECTEAELPTPSSSNVGWLYFVTDLGKYQVSDGTQWVDFGNYPIQTFALRSSFPATGAERTLYVAYDEAKVYWWNGTAYVSEIDDIQEQIDKNTSDISTLEERVGNMRFKETAEEESVVFEGDEYRTWKNMYPNITEVNGSGILGKGSSAPSSSTSEGVAGQHYEDENYLYICIADNTWRRVALSTF